jgi:pimeloyl-ACP methyl ester carboxylesterase
MAATHPRVRRVPRAVVVLVAIGIVLVLVVVAFLGWASTPMMGNRQRALEVWRDPAVAVKDVGDAVMLTPAKGAAPASGQGLVFIPGALVDPYAYMWKLSGAVVDTGLTVVITKPTLNLAFFDTRPLSAFTAHAPNVTSWYVGGHSLGGVRACQLAAGPDVKGLVLFGSYCANDLSHSALRVLSIGGTRDGLSTPAKIAANRHLLPATATLVEIRGMDHAQFGDYGAQPGDNPATISDRKARAQLTTALDRFLG